MTCRPPARTALAPAFLAWVCAGCAHEPIERPTVEVPGAFSSGATFSAAAAPSEIWPAADWYGAFHSEELNALILQARSGNLDLEAAQARIRQANAHARAAGAALLPAIALEGNVARIRGHVRGETASETDSSLGLTASYEVDFWGANRASRNSAALSAVARQLDRDTLSLTTDAAVANTYFLVLSLRERGAAARADLEAARQMLVAVEARFREGMTGPLEVASQRALVAAAELVPPDLAQQEREASIALALLVGRAPEAFRIEASSLEGIAEPALAPGIPAELIARRPDIAAAEYELAAAHADLLRARAAFFPTITLTTTGALQNPGFNAAVTTLSGTGSSISFSAALVQAIFDGGQRAALRDEVKAREDELLAAYRSAILAALGDVENTLSELQQLDAQKAAQVENVTQSERALEGAQLRYREGAGDVLALLEAQRAVAGAHDKQGVYRLARLQTLVGLGKALGGGWKQ